MTIQDLGSIGEFIAALATLATLAYIAIQVNHAKRDFRESSQRARTEFTYRLGVRSADQQLDWFSPDGQNKVMMKALLTDERLTREEGFEFAVQMSIFLGGLIQTEFLHNRGLLDAEFMQTRRSIYRPYLEMPRVRKWWKRTGREFYGHTEAFEVVEKMVAEIEAQEGSDGAPSGPSPTAGS